MVYKIYTRNNTAIEKRMDKKRRNILVFLLDKHRSTETQINHCLLGNII